MHREKQLLAELEAAKMRMANALKEAELKAREGSLRTTRLLEDQLSELKARLTLAERERVQQIETAKLDEKKRALDSEERARKAEQQLAKLGEDLSEAREEIARLETRLSKVPASKGQAAEIAFNEHLGLFEHLRCSDKLSRYGDYEVIVKVARFSGEIVPIEEPILADVKDVAVTDGRIRKLVEDSRARKRRLAAIVVSCEDLLRPEDKRHPFTVHDGVFVLATTRDAFPRDAFLLAPLLEQLTSGKMKGTDAESKLAYVVNEIGSRLALLGRIVTATSRVRKGIDGISKEMEQIDEAAKQFGAEIRALLHGTDAVAVSEQNGDQHGSANVRDSHPDL
jgi:hypothetical protein